MMNTVHAQIPGSGVGGATPATISTAIRTCIGNPSSTYFIFSVAMKNECGAYLNGYPFNVKWLSGSIPLAVNNANTSSFCSNIWGYATTPGSNPTNFTISPGYANSFWRGNLLTCCYVDTLPAYSPDAAVNLNFTTFGSPLAPSVSVGSNVYSGTGTFNPQPYYTFTITNPYIPKYTVQGKSLDMSHTEVIGKCGANSINTVDATDKFGTTVQYKVTVYNSDINKTIGSVFYPGSWQSALPPYLDATGQALGLAVNGNYYIIEVAVRSSCSTGSGAYVRGHLRYVTATAPTADFTINNLAVPTTCAVPLSLFNCSALTTTLNNTSNIYATQYNIELQKSPTACGVYTSVYNSGYLNTFPSDLKNLPGANGTYLQTNPGFYKIILTTKNSCGTVCTTPKIGYFNFAAPVTQGTVTFSTTATTKPGQTITIGACIVPAVTQYIYADGTPSCGGASGYKFAMQQSDVTLPNDIGMQQSSINILVTGTGSNAYQVTHFVDKWSGTNWLTMNYIDPISGTIAGETYNNQTSQIIQYLPEDNPLNPNYDAISLAPNGTIFRIKTVVSDACGSVTNTQIIRKNTTQLKRLANPNLDEIEKAAKELTIYPNPFTDKLKLEFSANEKYTNIEIIDITGKIVYSNVINEETELVEIDTKQFAKGVYLYKLKSDTKISTGKIIKQ